MRQCETVAATEVKLQDRSQSPPSAAVRLTRSQLAKKDSAEALANESAETPEGTTDYFVSGNGIPAIETYEPANMSETGAATMDAPASPLPIAVPNVIKSLRSETPAKRSTSNKENVQPEEIDRTGSPRMQSSDYDALEQAVIAASTPPRSEARASPRPEDSIAALDELEDAVENVSREIPEVQPSPAKSKAKSQHAPATSGPAKVSPKSAEKKPEVKKRAEKAAPVVRTTKAAQARLSMAQNKDAASKAPGLGRPRPSVTGTLGRSTSLRQSVAPKAEGAPKRVLSNPTASAATRVKSTKPAVAHDEPRQKKETVIPHSKPRPVSLSFPTPPPPTKSTKATTQSTFQLPGEAVAAKLKAAREARLAREAEEAEKKEKKVAFKARPAPKSTTEAPSVRQTNASRARESIMTGKPVPAPTAAATKSHKRSNTVAVSTADRPRTVSKDTTSKPTTSFAASTATRPRPSTSLANISKVRSSLSTTGQRVPSSGTSKGKEVFARAANAKATAEREKTEKEAAAKRARAEAAERGRVASREWAEKRRLKMEGAKKAAGEAKMEVVEAVGGTVAGGKVAAVDAESGLAAPEKVEAATA